jgi:two-component system OmpR family sensor kinase
MTRLSLRGRLTAWYALAVAAALIVFALAVLWQQSRIGEQRIDRELDAISATLRNILGDELREGDSAARSAEEALALVSAPRHAVAILDDRGMTLAAEWNGLSVATHGSAAAVAQRGTVDSGGSSWRTHLDRYAFERATFDVIVAAPLADVRRERQEAIEAMTIGIPVALLLAAGGGMWLASIGLRPLSAMAERAAAMPLGGASDLGESDRRDELGQLARAFNGLVARLRAALQTQRQFMADASHELRTPVSVMRSAADVALSRSNRPESDYRETLDIVRAQGRRVTRLVEDMLVLARADAGGYPLAHSPFYVDELVADACRTLSGPASERGVTFRTSGPSAVQLHGDEDLIRRLVLNVIQNAVQHSPAGSVVDVQLTADAHRAVLRVTDQGSGIPEADRARIFDRFVQLEASRKSQGAGLGLPIARWIADAHAGSLTLESTGPTGSTFTIVLPIEH